MRNYIFYIVCSFTLFSSGDPDVLVGRLDPVSNSGPYVESYSPEASDRLDALLHQIGPDGTPYPGPYTSEPDGGPLAPRRSPNQ